MEELKEIFRSLTPEILDKNDISSLKFLFEGTNKPRIIITMINKYETIIDGEEGIKNFINGLKL